MSKAHDLAPLRLAERQDASRRVMCPGGQHGDIHLDLGPVGGVGDGPGRYFGGQVAEEIFARVRGPVT